MNRLFHNNDNERSDDSPRFIFANLRRPSRAILSYKEYKRFTNTTIIIWLLLAIIVWIFRVEITVSENTMTSIASSSVELAGLALTVLGILHEFNDKYKDSARVFL